MIFPRNGASLLFTAAAIFLTVTPAAAITCKDGYQLVQGNYLATPYCQDDLLAKVARQYGMRTSASAIRENPNYKREVCRLVGRDIRVQQTCIDANAYGRRAF
ncbi:MAG: hypothetical protein ABL897_12840 [Hyphomicrobium sp.]